MSDQNDFRGRTCGECAWERNGNCRRVMWGMVQQFPLPDGWASAWTEPGYFGVVDKNDPACPAFVPREEPKP